MVNEVANQPSDGTIKSHFHTSKNAESATATNTPNTQPQTNAISSINNNIVKSDILTVNENKTLGPDVAVEPSETPVVSAVSNSPVIVPKLPASLKPLQKNSEPNMQPLVLDTNKNAPATKQQKQTKMKPVVPQDEEMEKPLESSEVVKTPMMASVVPPLAHSVPPLAAPVPPHVAVVAPPAPVPAVAPIAPVTPAAPAAPFAPPPPPPQPQPQRVPRERLRSEGKDKTKDPESIKAPLTEVPTKPNGPVPPACEYIFQIFF